MLIVIRSVAEVLREKIDSEGDCNEECDLTKSTSAKQTLDISIEYSRFP
jgi:hypothetical protein